MPFSPEKDFNRSTDDLKGGETLYIDVDCVSTAAAAGTIAAGLRHKDLVISVCESMPGARTLRDLELQLDARFYVALWDRRAGDFALYEVYGKSAALLETRLLARLPAGRERPLMVAGDHIWHRRANLTGVHVRVTYQKSKTYQDFPKGKEPTGYNGRIFKYVKIPEVFFCPGFSLPPSPLFVSSALREHFNFSYSASPPVNDSGYGSLRADGSFTGLVGVLQRQEGEKRREERLISAASWLGLEGESFFV